MLCHVFCVNAVYIVPLLLGPQAHRFHMFLETIVLLCDMDNVAFFKFSTLHIHDFLCYFAAYKFVGLL